MSNLRDTSTASSPAWSPTSWQDKPVAQPIEYEDQEHLNEAIKRLKDLPDLVPRYEIDQLSLLMRFAAQGQIFLIQGGDCAEAFSDIRPDIIKAKQQLLIQQAEILSEGLEKPVVPIGRIAGQYSKPRSSCFETLSCGTVVHAFRGENINECEEKLARSPDPERLCMGYHFAAVTLSALRASRKRDDTAINAAIRPSSGVFTSHEALHLPLETAMTRRGYNTSAHMLWIGERTRQIAGAHVEYMRGLRNPIGVKIGPASSAADIVELLDCLNPRKAVGKNVLITRFGASNVKEKLPGLIRAVRASGHLPVWLCDPCHGNTQSTPAGVKTRFVEDMLDELKTTALVHAEQGSALGGIHVEETGEEDVTECIERANVSLDTATFPEYRSLCDPRLSRRQAIGFVQSYVSFWRSQTSKAKLRLPSFKEDLYGIPSEARNVLAEEGVSAALKVRA